MHLCGKGESQPSEETLSEESLPNLRQDLNQSSGPFPMWA
jgi:hypothetical protein